MIKILHCADLHLGSAFTNAENISIAEMRKNELHSAFANLMMFARTNQADMLLISGDLFDSKVVSKDVIDLVLREFSASPKLKIIISPGNHDPFTTDSVYAKVTFPKNVYIFSSESLERIDFDDLNVTVYGYAFRTPRMLNNPFSDPFEVDRRRINIICGHGDTSSPASEYCPVTKADIINSRVDFIALGHIHNLCGIEKIENTYVGYPGCLDGKGFDETGEKGALFIKLDKQDGEAKLDYKFVRLSHRRYEIEVINATGIVDKETLIKKIKGIIATKDYDKTTMLRLIIEGSVPSDLNVEDIASNKSLTEKVASLEVKNRTTPQLDIEDLMRDPTIRGAFFEALKPMLEDESKEKRELAERALRYGLAALNGNNIIDFM